MPQGQPERPPWQVRISLAAPGPDGGLVEAGVPSGGGVWVGGRWVLTCAHVIGSEPRPVVARFSFAGGEPITATVMADGWLAGEQGDLALLELDRDPPSSARPAPLRPARAVTGHPCAAYGYPAGQDSGVWSHPAVTGQTVDRLQLTAQDPHGHQIEKGFSGTGLFDTETGAVVGLVVTRDKGKDVLGGFAIPLQTVVAAFPQLGPWVGWRLGTDRSLREHWRPRARGVYEDTTPGWYFTGRIELLRELTGWLERGSPDRAVRVVTGPAGTGKSAVLAWLCALSDPQLRAEIAAARPAALADAAAVVPAAGRVTAAVWARGLDADGAARALASALMLPVAADATVGDVLAAIGDLDPAERAGLVVVDALDEAQARMPREIARRLLVPLVRDLGVKVLAGTRPGRDDELLRVFGERAVGYRLDDPAWFDRQDLADYAAACLRADFDLDFPSAYRTDAEACQQVAAEIASAAGPNFLVAGLAARARADEPAIDVTAPGWRDRQRFPSEVGQAFDDYLSRYGNNETRAHDLLRAAAYAEGAGLPADAIWADIASALAAPRRYGSDDLIWLLDSAASYLIESSDEHGQPTYRIFHQALIEHLRPLDKEDRAQRNITSTLLAAVPRTASGLDWAHAPSYIRYHLAAHAAVAGLLDGLLEDPGFLAAANPSGLMQVLRAASNPQVRHVGRSGTDSANALAHRSNASAQTAFAYRASAPFLIGANIAMRQAYLHAASVFYGARELREKIERAMELPLWKVVWADWQLADDYDIMTGQAPINTVTTFEVRGRPHAVSAGFNDSVIKVWDLVTGGLVGDIDTGHFDNMGISISTYIRGGRPYAVTLGGSLDPTVRTWDLLDLAYVSHIEVDTVPHMASALATFTSSGRPYAITIGSRPEQLGSSLTVWDLLTGEPAQGIVSPNIANFDSFSTVTTCVIDYRLYIIRRNGLGRNLEVWDATAGRLLQDIRTGYRDGSVHFDTCVVDGVGHLVVMNMVMKPGGVIDVWNIVTGEYLARIPLGGYDQPRSIAAYVLNGIAHAIIGYADGNMRTVSLAAPEVRSVPAISERPRIQALDVADVAGQLCVIAGDSAGCLTVVDAHSGAPGAKIETGHTGGISALAIGMIGGRIHAITRGGGLRLTDLTSGAVTVFPPMGYSKGVRGLGTFIKDGNLHAICMDMYLAAPISIWDLSARQEVAKVSMPDMIWPQMAVVASFNGRQLLVTACDYSAFPRSVEDSIYFWDIDTGDRVASLALVNDSEWRKNSLLNGPGASSVAAFELDNVAYILATSSARPEATLWDLSSILQLSETADATKRLPHGMPSVSPHAAEARLAKRAEHVIAAPTGSSVRLLFVYRTGIQLATIRKDNPNQSVTIDMGCSIEIGSRILDVAMDVKGKVFMATEKGPVHLQLKEPSFTSSFPTQSDV